MNLQRGYGQQRGQEKETPGDFTDKTGFSGGSISQGKINGPEEKETAACATETTASELAPDRVGSGWHGADRISGSYRLVRQATSLL